MKAIYVEAQNGYKIKVVFENGQEGVVELESLVQKGVFRQLLDKTEFGKVYINGSAIAWSEDLEIDINTIYAEITNTEPVRFSHKPVYHAAD